MKNFTSFLLIPALISGQLIKIPLFTHGGMILLDFIVIILTLYGSLRLKMKFQRFSIWVVTLFAFIFIQIISLLFTPLDLTFKESYTSFSYIIRFFAYTFIGFLIINGGLKEINNNLNQIFTFSAFFLANLGIVQFLIFPDLSFLTNFGWDPHYFRVVSTFLDPNFLGAFLALSLIMLVQNPPLGKKWSRFFFTVIFLALLLTFSRGAYLGFGSAFLTLSILNKSKKLFVLTIILCLILISSFYLYQRLVAYPRNIDRGKSAESRLSSYQQGISLFQKHPILGVGFNAYRFAIRKYSMGNEQFIQSHGASTNDSSFLFVLATTGVVGFLSYFLFLIYSLYLGVKNYLHKNVYGVILLSGMATLISQSFFSNTLFYPPLLLWTILIVSSNNSKHHILGNPVTINKQNSINC